MQGKSRIYFTKTLSILFLFIIEAEAFISNPSKYILSRPITRSNPQLLLDSTKMFSTLDVNFDAFSVDSSGQALFYSTIVHWILWDKAPTYVALAFDFACIFVALWFGVEQNGGI